MTLLLMLRELSVVEQRYRAVLEVLAPASAERPVVQLTRHHATAFLGSSGAGFMIRPCASRCRDATDQVADWRDL